MIVDNIDRKYFLMVNPVVGYAKETDIAVGCHICHEGKSWGRKHRLHLYIKNSYDSSAVACLNCGYRANMFTYLRDNFPTEYTMYRKEKRSESFEKLVELKIGKSKSDIESFNDNIQKIDLNFDGSSSSVSTRYLLNEKETKNITDKLSVLPEKAIEYLSNRGLNLPDVYNKWYYAEKFTKIPFNNKDVLLNDMIVVPLIKDNQWYGFQALGIYEKKFLIHLHDNVPEGNKVWNFGNIDKDEKVYIFESIYDAISSGKSNIIAQLGASLTEIKLKELKHPVFCLDNQNVDNASYRESLNYLDKKYSVFLWPKGSDQFKDFNDLRKAGVGFDQISEFIDANIFTALKGKLKLKLLKA